MTTNESTTVRPVTGLVARDEGLGRCAVCSQHETVDRLSVELARAEGDLAVAVHEATTARAEVAELTELLRSLPGLITSTAGQRHSGQVGAAVRRSAMAEASELVRLAVAESVGSRRDARAAAHDRGRG